MFKWPFYLFKRRFSLFKSSFYLFKVSYMFMFHMLRARFYLLNKAFHLFKVWYMFVKDSNHQLFKWSFHLFQRWFLLLKKIIVLVQGLMKSMSMTLTITCSNHYFTYSNMSFCCWKMHCTCSRSDAKHVHDTNHYLFKWLF